MQKELLEKFLIETMIVKEYKSSTVNGNEIIMKNVKLDNVKFDIEVPEMKLILKT